MAALIALGFEGALRPGDLLYLVRGDLRFPRDHGGFSSALFVVLRHSKTRNHREAARLQHVRITCPTVIWLVDRAFGPRDRASPLFSWPGNHEARGRQLAAKFAAGICIAVESTLAPRVRSVATASAKRVAVVASRATVASHPLSPHLRASTTASLLLCLYYLLRCHHF